MRDLSAGWDFNSAFSVMPREGGASSIPEAARLKHSRLWNTGSSGQAGRRHRRRQQSAFPRQDLPEFCDSITLRKVRGRRECRALDAPAASCVVENARVRNHRYAETIGTPCAMVYGLYVLSSVNRAFLPPSFAGSLSANLIPASEDQDHTISPSASAPLVRRHPCVHRIPRPTFVTIAKRPSCERETREKKPVICPTRQARSPATE
jgi:hypothetical protein